MTDKIGSSKRTQKGQRIEAGATIVQSKLVQRRCYEGKMCFYLHMCYSQVGSDMSESLDSNDVLMMAQIPALRLVQ